MSISDFVALVGSVLTVSGAIAVAVRYILNDDPLHDKTRVIAVTGTILVVLLVFFLLIHSVTTITVAGQSTVFGPPNAPTATSLSAATPLPTATPTPTTPPRIINENLTFQCVSDCCVSNCYLGGPVSISRLVLDTITIDYSQNAMSWKFTATSPDGVTGSGLYFSKLDLQDRESINPRTYEARGSAMTGTVIAPGQSADLIAVFDFIPQSGINYTLSTNLYLSQYPDLIFTF